MLCATRRSRAPGSNLMIAEQEPEPRESLVLVLFRACSRSSRSPAICSRLRRRQDGRVSDYSEPMSQLRIHGSVDPLYCGSRKW